MNETCPVCGEALEGPNVATCNLCGNRFHLVTRMDVPGRDCGDVWINEEFLALEFACALCLGRTPAGPDAEAEQGERKRYVRRTGTRAADLMRERRRRRQ